MPTVHREVGRAEQAGRVGPTRLVRANASHPLYEAVRQVVLGTYGPPAIVAREFEAIRNIAAVLLFGSWAAR